MEDTSIDPDENELVSRTSCLLHLYEKRAYLQQTLQQYQIRVKLSCGMW